MVIHKYTFPIKTGEHIIPKLSGLLHRVLDIQVQPVWNIQDGEEVLENQFVVWTMEDTEKTESHYIQGLSFLVLFTGHEYSPTEAHGYIKTIQHDNLVYHIFYKII